MVLETPVIILRSFDTIFPLGTGSETEVFLITQDDMDSIRVKVLVKLLNFQKEEV